MKTKNYFLGTVVIIILALLVYHVFFQHPKQYFPELFQKILRGLPNSVPIKADGGGGVNLAPAPTYPLPTDKVILKVDETTGMPINVKVNGIFLSKIEAKSYWCAIYNYENPFPCKFVEVDAVAPSDPNANGIHATGFLNAASPSITPGDLNRIMVPRDIYTSNFSGMPNPKYYFIDVQNLTPPNQVMIHEEIFTTLVSGTSATITNDYNITDRKILFVDVKPSSNVSYKLTHNGGPNVVLNVYVME